MTSEIPQIANLIKSKSEKVENICYKEVYKIKLDKRDGNNPIVFNTKSILTNLIDYSNAYIEFQFDIKLKNINIHTGVVKYDDTNKDIFLTKNGDTMRVVCNVFLKDISNFFKNLNMPLKFSEFNLTLKLVDSIYVTDQLNTSQTLASANLYVEQVTLHEMEEIQFVKNYNNFDVNISFLQNFVMRGAQSITNGNFNVAADNCTNTNDMFLMLIKDENNTLQMPNKRAKDLQLYIGNQIFQTGIKSNIEAYLELKKRNEYFDEFIIDYNRFLNNYTIYAFPINRYSRKDKSTKYINITGVGVDEDDSKATLVRRQMPNINLKINNNSLEIRKAY